MKFEELEVGQKFMSCTSKLIYVKLDSSVFSCGQEVQACCISTNRFAGQCMTFSPDEEVIPLVDF